MEILIFRSRFFGSGSRMRRHGRWHALHCPACRSYRRGSELFLWCASGCFIEVGPATNLHPKALTLKPDVAEYHRILGTLCGQVIPANVLLGAMKYGKCAQESINKAIELDGKSAISYVSRGIGNYYLPAQFGGGLDVAIKDFDKAIQLDPKNAEAYLWRGIARRKANQVAEARQDLQKALQLNPNRLWTKQQLDKTPAK